MGVAADCRYVQDKGGKDQATQAILADWNSATALYRVRVSTWLTADS